MFNLSFASYDDVYRFLAIVGVDGFKNAFKSEKVDYQDKQWMIDFVSLVNDTTICINEFNDGNNVYEEYVYLNMDNIVDSEYYHTRSQRPIKLNELKDGDHDGKKILDQWIKKANLQGKYPMAVGLELN